MNTYLYREKKIKSLLSKKTNPIRSLAGRKVQQNHQCHFRNWTKSRALQEGTSRWPVSSGQPTISDPESSGFLVSGATPGRLWGHRKNLIFLIGCFVTVSIVLPQKSCGSKIRCPQSLPGVAPLTKKPEDSGYEIGQPSPRVDLSLLVLTYRKDSGELEFYYRKISEVKTMQAVTGQPIKKFNFFRIVQTRWPKSLRTLGTRLQSKQNSSF